jgi:hypothetical protein
MDLEDIMLSEISQHRKANTVHSHLYVEAKKLLQRSREWNSDYQSLGRV